MSCHLFQVMGLIKKNGLITGQYLAEACFSYNEIREEEVMVHHKQIRVSGITAEPGQETGRPIWAGIPQTKMALATNLLPKRCIARQPIKLCSITLACVFNPLVDFLLA